MRKIKLTRANKSILLKALAPYYYREKALGHSTEKPGRLILKINAQMCIRDRSRMAVLQAQRKEERETRGR